MKYLCLAYYDEARFNAMTKDERNTLVEQCPPHDKTLRESGNLLMVASLAGSDASVSIRPKQGNPSITDGPYAETKEQLGSFFIIEARDLNEAVRIASKHPAAVLGEQVGWGIEVRPIELFNQLESS